MSRYILQKYSNWPRLPCSNPYASDSTGLPASGRTPALIRLEKDPVEDRTKQAPGARAFSVHSTQVHPPIRHVRSMCPVVSLRRPPER